MMKIKPVCRAAHNLLCQQQSQLSMLNGKRPSFHTFVTRFQSTTSHREERSRHEAKQKAWNEAASIMIVAPMNNSEPYYLGYLMLERSRTGRVFPGSWVYPGGNVDSSDYSVKWIDLFKEMHNIDILKESFLRDSAQHPQIYIPDNGDLIPKQISLRITAIREAFEEAGILLCRPRKLDPAKHLHKGMLHYEFEELQDKKEVQAWQKRVRKNGAEFIKLCRELDCAPDIHAAHEWNNWLTPTNFKPRLRFDTLYYIILLPRMVRVVIDGNEAVNAQWISPERVISEHGDSQIRVLPPQIYEFSRMRPLKTLDDLRQRIKLRNELGIERYFPVVRNVKDGTLFLLPGDDLYPDPPDFIETVPHSLEQIPKTIAELKKSSVNLHRGIANSDGAIVRYDINVNRYGHIY